MNQLDEILEGMSSKPNLNKENIIDEVKNALQEKDLSTYNQWREDKFNINYIFYGKDTLLHLAAEYGTVEMAKALIENDADVNAVDTFGEVPLHYAVRYGEIEIMKVLIKNRTNVNALDKLESTPLHTAVQEAPRSLRVVIVKVLIENGADVNAVRECVKDTPLHLTVISDDDVDTVRVLIENGANVNVAGSCKNTPLHYAARYGCVRIVRTLIENGADVNAINEYDKDTPLHLAVKNNHLEIVKYLIDRGANIHVEDIHDKIPLDYAREKGYGEIVEYLTDKMATMPHNKDKALQVYQNECFDDDTFLADYYLLRGKKIDERKEGRCSIQSYQRQEEDLFKFISYDLPSIEIKPVRQGLYLPSFEERGIEINGKCVSITRGLSQALFLQGEKSFLSNLETSAEIYERITQGKQISKREEREVFALSKLLDTFEQLDSPTSSLPSDLIHTKNYKTIGGLSNYIAGVKGDFAIHLITSNHVVAIYRTGDNYAYFDSNTAFVSGLKSVDQLMVAIGKVAAGYKVEKKGFLVEHFDVDKANKLCGDKQILASEIKTERQLLAEQDKKLGLIKINGQELSRVQLYDFGTKVNVEGSVPLLINADMNLDSKNFLDYLNAGKISMTAREYLDHLKSSKNVEEVVQATKFIPFIGSKREIEEAEQAHKPEFFKFFLKQSIKCLFTTSNDSQQKSRLPKTADETNSKPESYLSGVTVNNQLERSPARWAISS